MTEEEEVVREEPEEETEEEEEEKEEVEEENTEEAEEKEEEAEEVEEVTEVAEESSEVEEEKEEVAEEEEVADLKRESKDMSKETVLLKAQLKTFMKTKITALPNITNTSQRRTPPIHTKDILELDMERKTSEREVMAKEDGMTERELMLLQEKKKKRKSSNHGKLKNKSTKPSLRAKSMPRITSPTNRLTPTCKSRKEEDQRKLLQRTYRTLKRKLTTELKEKLLSSKPEMCTTPLLLCLKRTNCLDSTLGLLTKEERDLKEEKDLAEATPEEAEEEEESRLLKMISQLCERQ